MKILKIELTCRKDRWIFSAISTIFLISAIFILPTGNLHKGLNSAQKTDSQNIVSIVSVKKKPKAAPIDNIEKQINKLEDKVIPKQQIIEQLADKKIESEKDYINENISEETIGGEEDSFEAAETSSEKVTAETELSEYEKKALASYKSYALGRIASKRTYPFAARSQGLEGKIRIRMVINPDGNVSKIEILEKCEYEILNEACLNTIKKAEPFKKMTKGQRALTLTFVMDFSLN